MRWPLMRFLHRSWYNRVQILSDLHLEIGQQYASFTFPATAPFLLLAGDIGRLIDYDAYLCFLQAQTSRYDTVLLVLGNHEFYGLSYAGGLATARRLTAEPSLRQRLVLLHRARWDSPRGATTVLGCTLWSAIPAARAGVVQAKVSDFKKIQGWTTAAHNEAHEQEATWLREQVARLAGEADRHVLVATHHAPCVQGTSLPQHADSPWTSAFATEMLAPPAGADWGRVRTWVFGHTHYSTDMVRAGVRIVANQRGYVFPPRPGVVGSTMQKSDVPGGFDPCKVVIM